MNPRTREVPFEPEFFFFFFNEFVVFVKLSDGGTVNLLSRSYGVYNFNELGLQKCTSSPVDETDGSEKTYQCASHEMRIFGAIGSGASSVVQRAIHIPNHRILALKKINIFEKVLLANYVLLLCTDIMM